MTNELKSQIFDLMRSRFQSAGFPPPKEILIYYQDGKKVWLSYDGKTETNISFSENLIMKNFIISQLKSQISKNENDKKVKITAAVTTLSLKDDVIFLDAFYITKDNTEKEFHHKF